MRGLLFRTGFHFWSDRGASVPMISAAVLLVSMAASALALDLGNLHLKRRQDQGVADLAAMAAASDLTHATTAATATLAANGIVTPTGLNVEVGHYTADAALAPDQRFHSGQLPSNAARVTLTTTSSTYFAKIFGLKSYDITVRAVSSQDSLAAFSIGSRLLSLNGGVINALLGSLFGSNVDLSVMDYNALANFNVQLFPFLDALATQVNIKAGTYTDVLNANAKAGDILSALLEVSNKSGNATTTSALSSLVLLASQHNAQVDLPSLVSLGPLGGLSIGSQPAGLVTTINALQMIQSTAALSNGQRQVSLDLTAAVPGLLSLKADIAVGEPMQHSPYAAVGDAGATVTTAQTRIRLVAQIGGTGLLSGATIRLPIYLDLAYAKGQLSNIACNADGSGTVDVAVTPGVAQIWIGDGPTDLTDFSSDLSVQSAKLVELSLAKVFGRAQVNAGNTSPTTLTFEPSEIGSGTIKQVDTDALVGGAVSSLLRNMSVTVQFSGLNLALATQLNSLVTSTLQGVAAPLDAVVNTLLATLGVHIGEADVTVDGVRCRSGGILTG